MPSLVPLTLLGAVAALVVGHGQPPATAARAPHPLAGTWTLVAADRIGADGVRGRDYGDDPKGRLIIDDSGRYSLQIFRSDRPRFAAGTKPKGTPEEFAAAALGSSTHYGSVEVDASRGILTFRIERASFPNWDGSVQERHYTLTGDELSYQVPPTATGDGTTAISVWRRVR